MQRFGLSHLIAALQEEISSSQILKSSYLVSTSGRVLIMVLKEKLSFHIHLASNNIIVLFRILHSTWGHYFKTV